MTVDATAGDATAGDAVGKDAVLCRGLTKSYSTPSGSVPALRGVDLDVRAREILFLVGPSGCGKTTLISLIAGVLRRDSGQCLIFGTDLDTLVPREATSFRRDNIGFVFQSYNLIPSLSVQDNVMIPLLLKNVPQPEAAKEAAKALDAVGLGVHRDKMPSQLSGGQQQRVAVARAIVHAPRLMVCDEPTSALDHTTGKDVMKLLRSLARDRGTTLIVVTHDQRIFDFADRIAQMDDGRIIGVGTASAAQGLDA
ncbi:MAG: ABC transporter ATP-binding protein [Azospirillaceae bacterium]|nr:ABC transporter ATP-binding protein [Azospirillaceae bacterium]